METLKLLIPKAAINYYEKQFKADPWAEFQPVIGDDNFVMLIIDEPIMEDIERIAEAAENYGFNEGWEAVKRHNGQKDQE